MPKDKRSARPSRFDTRRAGGRVERKKNLSLVFILLFAAFIAGELFLAFQITRTSKDFKMLTGEKKELEDQVIYLKSEISQNTSLERVKSRAEGLGLVKGEADYLPAPSLAQR